MIDNRLKIGMIVKHFKREIQYMIYGNPQAYLYKILGFATHTETKENLVIYESLYNSLDGNIKVGDVFARPYDMFMSEVDHEKYPDIKQKYRFEPVGE